MWKNFYIINFIKKSKEFSWNIFDKHWFLLYFIYFSFIIFIICYKLFYQIKEKQLKVCLCVIGKKENLYATEFVEHYKKLGYNKIFIYDNNDLEDEKFEDVIQNEIDNGFVSIINIRGYKGQQFASYKDCYGKNNIFYDWLSFFDFDEFLELNPKNTTIQKFLKNKRFKKCQNIKINWVFYFNSNSLNYENKPVQQRIYSSVKLNKHIKSTVRGNLSIKNVNEKLMKINI